MKMAIMKKVVAVLSSAAMLFSTCINSSLAVIAETTSLDKLDFSVNIPDDWTNTFNDWIEVSENTKVYFKVSDRLQDSIAWGTYTDPDAREWNQSVDLSETDVDGDYIKFWAVRNGIIQDDPEAVHFYYDKTKPNNFNVAVDEETEPYTLKSSDIITDSLSGISGIYYSVAQEYDSVDAIRANCIEAVTIDDRNGMRFSAECTSDMSDNIVYFYVIDFAGNIQTSSIKITSYMDTSAPSLIVDGIDENMWVNRDTLKNTWNIHTESYGAKVYYKVSDTDLLDSWGDYSDAIEWSENATILEGEKYIHFWAAYDSAGREVAEETRFYKYDNTSPQEYTIKPEPQPGGTDSTGWHEPTFYVYGANIYDAMSGISRIYYTATHNEYETPNEIDVNFNALKQEDNGTYSFTLDMSKYFYDRVTLTYYVVDEAGNTTKVINENISYDSQSPMIVTGSNNTGITYGIDANSPTLSPISFGGEKTGTLWNSVYVNNNDHYIKVVINDNNLSEIRVYVDGAENGIAFSQDGTGTQGKKWICADESNNNQKAYFIKISELGLEPDMKHRITVSAFDGYNTSEPVDLTFGEGENEQEYTIFYDPKDENDSKISFIPNEESESIDGYYGAGVGKNNISIIVNDDNGLNDYVVKVNGTDVVSTDLSKGELTTGTYTTEITKANASGEVQSTKSVGTETYSVPVKSDSYKLSLDDKYFIKNEKPIDGKYDVEVCAKDLAENESFKTYSFIIDTIAPEINLCEYQYNRSLLRYLSFGLFGNESYKISVEVYDPEVESGVPGIGVESVVLEWGSKSYEGKYNADTNKYDFDALPIGHKDIPVIIVTDRLGNSANYCMVSSDSNDDNHDNKAAIQLNAGKGKIPLSLENTLPVSTIIPPEKFAVDNTETDALNIYKQSFEDGHVEWWYPSEIEYQITAQDADSGLYSVFALENNEQRAEEKKSDKIDFSSGSFTDLATYTYAISEEGDYNLFTYAIDNAQNSNKINSKASQSLVVHLDKTKPQITEFQFGGHPDQGDTVERTTYGFFFVEDTEIRVYVDDTGVSSGLNNVKLYLKNVNGDDKTFTKAASSFDTDQQNGRKYASFTIEKGFKGKVISIVTDNVGHSSGLINANGNIVEDPELHSRASSIEIKENESAKQNDANGVPLYNTSIPVTVTVIDNFSGISRIDWSIADDNEAGTIEVDIEGTWKNISGNAQILEDSIERDQNLITKLQFEIVVDSNTNGNAVHVTLTDRSGNTSEFETQYSIDTTEPTISATLEGGAISNDYYYNTSQRVIVSITERNFDPNAVVVRVNNNIQAIQWNEQNSSVTSDGTVHTGTFVLAADGEYDFSISYTDMAGNVGAPYSHSRFIIDKTSPKISNNFDSFGSMDDENIYYNISQKDKTKAEITVVETNFFPEDMNINVYYQPAGSKHTDSGANWTNYYYSSDWHDSGDNTHTLSIPFTEDGVYKISMSPIDRAGNVGDFSKDKNSQYPNKTAIFETDYTAPIIVSRDNKSVKSNDVKFYDLYDFERRNDEAPTVIFEDTNIEKIVCDGQKYTPVYTNGREIGKIKPENISSESKKLVTDAYVPQMIYTLEGFTVDGVYSAKLTAYDKAGNKSTINDNTYVRMVDPTVNVLAYIENSNRENMEGWYSFEDENGPISKQPNSFSDLNIVVFSKSSDTHVLLVDKATNTSTDTNITDTEDSLFDKKMYGMGAYRYTLPGTYFEKNYTADADTNLYLRVENDGNTLDLGEMYIDNTDPDCNIPKHFHDWGWFKGSGNQSLTFDGVSEVLDVEKTVAYVDGQTIYLSNTSDNDSSIFSYDEENNTLMLTLEPGGHKVGLLLVDRAGNSKSINEVRHLAIGNYRIWIGIGFGLGVILLISIIAFIVKRRKHV